MPQALVRGCLTSAAFQLEEAHVVVGLPLTPILSAVGPEG